MNEKEILQYLLDRIPMIYDMRKEDLKYDQRSMYYKIYKYITELKEKIKSLEEK